MTGREQQDRRDKASTEIEPYQHPRTLRSCLSNGSLPLLPFLRMVPEEEAECPGTLEFPSVARGGSPPPLSELGDKNEVLPHELLRYLGQVAPP